MRSLKKTWIHHRNRLARGQTEISLFYGVIQTALLLSLFLRDIMTFHRVWLLIFLPACFLGVTALMYLIGWYMDTHGLIDELQDWDAERNPMLKEIRNIVKEGNMDETLIGFPPAYGGVVGGIPGAVTSSVQVKENG